MVHPVLFLSLIASMLFVTSCEGDEEIIEADLIGTWDIGDPLVDLKVEGISMLQFLKITLQMSDQDAQAMVDDFTSEFSDIGGGTITFNEDYSYQMVKGDLEENGAWELEGNKLYLTITGELQDDDPLLIESLNSTSAIIAWEEEEEVDVNEDGTNDITVTISIELNLSKQ